MTEKQKIEKLLVKSPYYIAFLAQGLADVIEKIKQTPEGTITGFIADNVYRQFVKDYEEIWKQ